MDRFHAPAPKIMKCLAGALLLTLLLTALLLTVPFPDQAIADEEDWVIISEEHFGGDQPQDWELGDGCGVEDGMLVCGEPGQARCTKKNLGEVRVIFRLVYLNGGLDTNVRVSETGLYAVRLHREGYYSLSLRLFRCIPPDECTEPIDEVEVNFPDWDLNTWVEIIATGGNIQVKVYNEYENIVVEYTDKEPLPPGDITFKALYHSEAYVDDIFVYEPPPEYILTMAVDGGGFTEPEVGNHTRYEGEVVEIRAIPHDGWEFAGWDGAVADPDDPTTARVTMNSDKTVIALFSEIPTYTLTIEAEGGGWTEPWMDDYAHPAGEEVTITAIADDGWEFAGWDGAVADPDNPTTEVLMDSDKTVIAYFSEIPNLWPPIIGGTVFILAGTLSTQQVIKSRRHKKWQKEAKEEEPQELCQPGARCCQKVEVECELARCQVKHLTLAAHDAVSGKPDKKKQIKGGIVDGLNRVIAAGRRGAKPEKLEEQVAPLARRLLQQITKWLRPEPAPRDVSVIGHLEGCKVTYKFILKRCQETRTWGKAEDEWKVTIKEERDEPLSALPGLEPTKIGMLEQLTAELTRQLMKFIELGR